MFETTVGPVKAEGSTVYLRPETAQGIFLNFKHYLQFSRKRPPFGIAQIGKSFRNEITPGNFIFRTREFEQMEMEFFVPPDEAPTLVRALARRARALVHRPRDPARPPAPARPRADRALALLERHQRRRVPVPDRLAGARGDRQPRRLRSARSTPSIPARSSSTSTPASGERYVPHVIEPAAGADRATLAFLVDAYDEDEIEGETRTVLRLHPQLAPVKVAVLPLVRKDGQPELAREIYHVAARRGCRPSTTRAARSAAAIAARTRSARRGA